MPIFQQLISPDSQKRLQAALAISSLSWALVHVPAADCLRNAIRTSLRSFVDSEKSRPGKASYSLFRRIPPPPTPLDDDEPYSFDQAMWALSVVSSLLVFSGGEVFSHRTSLKLVVCTLEDAKKYKNQTVRRIQGFVWRCLIWAYVQLPIVDSQAQNIERNCFGLLREELSGNIPLVLIGALLNLPQRHAASGDCMTRIITIMEDMNKQKKSRLHFGIKILRRLVGGIGEHAAITAWTVDKILPMDIINGKLLRTPTEAIPKLVDDLPDLRIGQLRVLSEEELRHHWHALLSLWASYVASYTDEYPSDMVSLIDLQ